MAGQMGSALLGKVKNELTPTTQTQREIYPAGGGPAWLRARSLDFNSQYSAPRPYMGDTKFPHNGLAAGARARCRLPASRVGSGWGLKGKSRSSSPPLSSSSACLTAAAASAAASAATSAAASSATRCTAARSEASAASARPFSSPKARSAAVAASRPSCGEWRRRSPWRRGPPCRPRARVDPCPGHLRPTHAHRSCRARRCPWRRTLQSHELVHEIAGLWVARHAARLRVAHLVTADAPHDEV